jgi:hypothetical protein
MDVTKLDAKIVKALKKQEEKREKRTQRKKEVKSKHEQSCFNKVGHLRVCKQSKRGWEPQIFN